MGVLLIGLIMLGAHFALRHAQRLIAERNERLARANFELTLAAKASALGQITSHLIHGLQTPVAGLQAMVHRSGHDPQDWQTAAAYTERLQAMIGETEGMLYDVHSETRYELDLRDIAEIVRARNQRAAAEKKVQLAVQTDGQAVLDNHRGSVACLIATNLIQNAIQAAPEEGSVLVTFESAAGALTVTVRDNGSGISAAMRDRLFQPGRSGRPGGTGLGLAISHLLARQIGAELELESTGPEGTTFTLKTPIAASV